MPTRLKEKFYRTAIRPAMTYGTKCWPIKKQHTHKMGVAEMRILRWICGKTGNEKIRNERIREHLRVTSMGDKRLERPVGDGLSTSNTFLCGLIDH